MTTGNHHIQTNQPPQNPGFNNRCNSSEKQVLTTMPGINPMLEPTSIIPSCWWIAMSCNPNMLWGT